MLKTGIKSSAYFGFTDIAEGLALIKKHGYDCVDYQGFVSPESELYRFSEKDFYDSFSDVIWYFIL